MLDIILAESVRREDGHIWIRHHSLQIQQAVGIVRSDRALKCLMCKRRNISLVDESSLGKETVGDGCSSCWSEHCTDIDCHIEEAEGRISLCRILRVIIEVAHHYLKIAFEQSCTDRNQQQRPDHQRDTEAVCRSRNSQRKISDKHNTDAGDHAFAVTDPVCEPSSDNRHEIYCSKENSIKLAGGSLFPAELGLQEQHENCQHGVIAETLPSVGKGQSIKTFRLTFKHYKCFKINNSRTAFADAGEHENKFNKLLANIMESRIFA